MEVEGKQNSLFPEGIVIKCFVIPPDSKIEKVDAFDAFGHLHTVAAFARLAAVKTER